MATYIHDGTASILSGDFGITDLIEEMVDLLPDELGDSIVEAEDMATIRLRQAAGEDARWEGLEHLVYVEVKRGSIQITHDDSDDVVAAEYGTVETPPSGFLRRYIEPAANEVTAATNVAFNEGVPLA